MTTTDTTDTTDVDLEAEIGAYADRLFETGLAALEAITISLGRQLGLYEHLDRRRRRHRIGPRRVPPVSTTATPRSGSSSRPRPD